MYITSNFDLCNHKTIINNLCVATETYRKPQQLDHHK